jgi:hypothetical protein
MASQDAAGNPLPGASGAADEPNLRDVVRRLLTPARAGLYLGRDDLARLGAALGFAVPALDRRIMLEHLLVAAGPAGLLPRLLELLRAEVEDWIATYAAWETAYPHTAPIWQEWQARAEALRSELIEMQTHAEAAARSSPA